MADRTDTAEYQRALELARGDAEKLRAIAERLHRNEPLDLHDDVSDPEPCRYCWLRAGQAVYAVAPRPDVRASELLQLYEAMSTADSDEWENFLPGLLLAAEHLGGLRALAEGPLRFDPAKAEEARRRLAELVAWLQAPAEDAAPPKLPPVTKTGVGYLRRFAEHTVHVYRHPGRPGNGVSTPALDRLLRDGLVGLGEYQPLKGKPVALTDLGRAVLAAVEEAGRG